MRKYIIAYLFTFISVQTISAQYEWQDPLNFGSIDVINKYALLYNIGGVVLSGWINNKKDYDGYWEAAFYAEYHLEYDPHDSTTDVFMGKARLGRQYHQWLQVGGEAQLLKFKNAETSTVGIGGAIYFNWYLINNDCFRLYFDNGFGVVGSTKNFPKGGTLFNFTSFYGLGSSIKLQSGTSLKIGVRNMHLSNAFLFGEHRNPSFDSIGFHIGFEFGNDN